MPIIDRMDQIVTRLLSNDRFGSGVGAVFFIFWIGQRFYFGYRSTFLWWLITAQFSLFVVAYLIRGRASLHARGFREVIYPFICAAMPFALVDYPFKPPSLHPVLLRPYAAGLMIAGSACISTGVFFLRRSFSIMTEVRSPVQAGIYRYCRHPMYLGSMISALGVTLYHVSYLNALIFLVFAGMQVYRSLLEERKIMTVHPEYADYAVRVGWIGKIGARRRLGGSLPGRPDQSSPGLKSLVKKTPVQ